MRMLSHIKNLLQQQNNTNYTTLFRIPYIQKINAILQVLRTIYSHNLIPSPASRTALTKRSSLQKPMIPRYLSQSLCISYVTRLLLIITTQHHNINTTLSCKNDLAYGVSQPYAKPAATARSSRYPYQCLRAVIFAPKQRPVSRVPYYSVVATCTSFTASNPILL